MSRPGHHRSRNEQALQIAVARFLDLALPATACWSAIGHGGGGAKRGAFLKAMGMKPGVGDILILYGGYAGMIELKSAHGTVSDAQKAWRDRWREAGGYWDACRSLEDVQHTLITWGIPLKGEVA